MPIALLFLTLRLSGEALVILYTAILSVSPQSAQGRAAGLTSLTSTAIGGGVSIVFYVLIVAVPSIWFFTVLLAITSLAFGAAIFSGRPYAQYIASAQAAMLILFGGAMGESVDFTNAIVTRIALIGLATVWVFGTLWLLERWFDPPALPPDKEFPG